MSRCRSMSTSCELSDNGKRKVDDDHHPTPNESAKRARCISSRYTPSVLGKFTVADPGNHQGKDSCGFKVEEEISIGAFSATADSKSRGNCTLISSDTNTSVVAAQKAMDVWKSHQLHLTANVNEAAPHPGPDLGHKQNADSAPVEKRSPAPSPHWSLVNDCSSKAERKTPPSGSSSNSQHALQSPNPPARSDSQPQLLSTQLPLERQYSTLLQSQRDRMLLHFITANRSKTAMHHCEGPNSLDFDPGKPEQRTTSSHANLATHSVAEASAADQHKPPGSSWKFGESKQNTGLFKQSLDLTLNEKILMPQSIPTAAFQLQNLPHAEQLLASSSSDSNLLSNVSAQEAGSFNPSSSTFFLSTKSGQQERTQTPKQSGKNSAYSNNEQCQRDKISSPVTSQPQAVSANIHSRTFMPKDRLPRYEPPLEDLLSTASQSGPPADLVSRGYRQSLQSVSPRNAAIPRPASPSQPSRVYRPPAVIFTIDNRAESPLSTADFKYFIDKFTQSVRVVVAPNQHTDHMHPIGVIMWQSLPEFYKWFSEVTGTVGIGAWIFELTDIHWQPEKSFVVPEGSLHYFRTLKQYIWDLHWVASHLSKGLSLFRVSISQLPLGQREHYFPPGSPYQPRWNAVTLQRTEKSGKSNNDSNLQQVMVVHEPYHSARSLPETRMGFPSPQNSPAPSSKVHGVREPDPRQMAKQSSPSSQHSFPLPNHQPLSPSIISGDPLQHTYCTAPSPANSSREYQSQSFFSPANSRRTLRDEAELSDFARAITQQHKVELLGGESTKNDRLPYRSGSEVCGVIIDRRSGKGMLTLTGKGYITQNIATGPNEAGDRFRDIAIQTEQTCTLHGGAAVLYYRETESTFRPPVSRSHMPRDRIGERVKEHLAPAIFLSENSEPCPLQESQLCNPSSTIDIIIRIQIDGKGKFSAPFDKIVLRPKLKTTDFFSWFAQLTRHSLPRGPDSLKFTFKDAMPGPSATEVERGNEDHFNYMRKYIKTICERARHYMPDMIEFGVLVTDPGWVDEKGEEEEEEDW
ncbi:unnamed protein product [Diplocarpon coronariae]